MYRRVPSEIAGSNLPSGKWKTRWPVRMSRPVVGVADVPPPEGDRRSRVELPGAESERGAAGARRPDAPSRVLTHRVHLSAVVAEVEDPVGQRGAALHGPGGPVTPANRSVRGAQRVHGAVLAAEVHVPLIEQRRGLAAAREVLHPARHAGARVDGRHATLGRAALT